MIRLTEEQIRQLREQGEQPGRVVDPSTGAVFVLVKEEVYEWFGKLTGPLDRGWDDPSLDVYEQYRERP